MYVQKRSRPWHESVSTSAMLDAKIERLKYPHSNKKNEKLAIPNAVQLYKYLVDINGVRGRA